MTEPNSTYNARSAPVRYRDDERDFFDCVLLDGIKSAIALLSDENLDRSLPKAVLIMAQNHLEVYGKTQFTATVLPVASSNVVQFGGPARPSECERALSLIKQAYAILAELVDSGQVQEGSPPHETLNYLHDAIGMLSPDNDGVKS